HRLFDGQAVPAAEIEFCPLGYRQWPVGGRAPFVSAREPVPDWRILHDAGIDALEPIIVPADYFVMQLMERSLQMRRPREHQLFGSIDILKIVLGTQPVEFVRVS